MSNLIKILSYGILFFINLFIFLGHHVLLSFKALFHFFYYLLIVLYFFGEENIIKNSSFHFPYNVALVINKEKQGNVIKSIINFIRWSLYANIRQITFYDPFDVLSKEFIENILLKEINVNFNKNYSIGFTYANKALDCKKEKEVNRKEMLSYEFNLIISVITFKSANSDLIEKYVKNNESTPSEIEFYKSKNDRLIKDDTKHESFYTRKKAQGLPELVICCGNEDICLYGFPFSLLENCEIVRMNEDLSEINVIDYMNIFKKYAKVNKRFGF